MAPDYRNKNSGRRKKKNEKSSGDNTGTAGGGETGDLGFLTVSQGVCMTLNFQSPHLCKSDPNSNGLNLKACQFGGE